MLLKDPSVKKLVIDLNTPERNNVLAIKNLSMLIYDFNDTYS